LEEEEELEALESDGGRGEQLDDGQILVAGHQIAPFQDGACIFLCTKCFAAA
jgi:hypothetical protein